MNTHLDSLEPHSYNELRNLLRIGVQEDTQVTSCNWGKTPCEDESQTVTQVFGSACSVDYSGNSKKLWAPFASLVLSASYEATMYAAMLTALRHQGSYGSRRVYLTCLGGGVFGNEMEWISTAMHDAFDKFRDVGLEVYIVTYCGEIDRGLMQLETEFNGQ